MGRRLTDSWKYFLAIELSSYSHIVLIPAYQPFFNDGGYYPKTFIAIAQHSWIESATALNYRFVRGFGGDNQKTIFQNVPQALNFNRLRDTGDMNHHNWILGSKLNQGAPELL
jgi:hypothetical protein